MKGFVRNDSVVRKIWGKSDTILFIFAGSAAEFALNKSVDWLFFTGKLPADPIGRLFSTVAYAREIVFSSEEKANRVIDRMADIHAAVESSRGQRIPAWAYRDVLFMLIDYSIRAHELLEHRLSPSEVEEVYDVFRRVGARMGLTELPPDYASWTVSRKSHMLNDLEKSRYTSELFIQYRKHLGIFRYHILLNAQGIIVPGIVREMLGLSNSRMMRFTIKIYKSMVRLGFGHLLRNIILPAKYLQQIKSLDIVSPSREARELVVQ